MLNDEPVYTLMPLLLAVAAPDQQPRFWMRGDNVGKRCITPLTRPVNHLPEARPAYATGVQSRAGTRLHRAGPESAVVLTCLHLKQSGASVPTRRVHYCSAACHCPNCRLARSRQSVRNWA